MINLDQMYDSNLNEWTLNDSIMSWDLINFIVNDLSQIGLKTWLKSENCIFKGLDSRISISSMVSSPLETSQRFILKRYLAPGFTAKVSQKTYFTYNFLPRESAV